VNKIERKRDGVAQVAIGISTSINYIFFQNISLRLSRQFMVNVQSGNVVEHPGQALAVAILATLISLLPIALAAYSERHQTGNGDTMRFEICLFVVLLGGLQRMIAEGINAVGGIGYWKYGSFLLANEVVALVGTVLVLACLIVYRPMEQKNNKMQQVRASIGTSIIYFFYQNTSSNFSYQLMIDAQCEEVVEHPDWVLARGILATLISLVTIVIATCLGRKQEKESDAKRFTIALWVLFVGGFLRAFWSGSEAINGFCSLNGWKYGSFLLANEMIALAGTVLVFAWLVACQATQQKRSRAAQVAIELGTCMCYSFFLSTSRRFSSSMMIDWQGKQVLEHPGQMMVAGMLATVLSLLPMAIVAYADLRRNDENGVIRFFINFLLLLIFGLPRAFLLGFQAIERFTEWKYSSFLVANEIVAMVGNGLIFVWILVCALMLHPDEQQETECLQANE
jgi:hypothetical protein